MKKLVSICLLCVLFFSMCACGTVNAPQYNNQVSRGSGSGVIFNNTIFYHDLATMSLKYQKIDGVFDSGKPIINDPLLEDELNPFVNLGGLVLMLVDREATAKNGGMPVLIITYTDHSDYENIHNSIVSFNTKTNEITTIKDDIYDNIQSLFLYNNVIYYTVHCGNEGYDMCRVDIDGKNFAKKDNPDFMLYRIQTIYKDKIYYITEGLEKVYSCNLDFSGDTFLTDAVLKSDFFVHEDYFYYTANLSKGTLGDLPTFSADLMRFPISDPSAAEQVIADISVGSNCGSKFYYYESAPRLIGGKYFDDGTNILKVLDLDTLESSVVYDYGDNTVAIYYDILSDSWIRIECYDYAPTLADSTASPTTEHYVINTETLERIFIPD